MGVLEHKAKYAIGNNSKNMSIKLIMDALKCNRGEVNRLCKEFKETPHQIAYEIYRETPEESEYHFFANVDYFMNWYEPFMDECDVADIKCAFKKVDLKNGYIVCRVVFEDSEQ